MDGTKTVGFDPSIYVQTGGYTHMDRQDFVYAGIICVYSGIMYGIKYVYAVITYVYAGLYMYMDRCGMRTRWRGLRGRRLAALSQGKPP